MDFLFFRLYGPLAAWGDIAVGQDRPSYAHPSKSALLGLMAAAMGVRREEYDVHQQMTNAYGFAVWVEASGVLLRDYHTSQVPPQRRHVTHYTRRDELGAVALNTILSSREYRCDALYTVALWHRAEQPAPFTLDELAAGLRQPRFTLYLGRKSCPLALPLQPAVVSSPSLDLAFAKADFAEVAEFKSLECNEPILVYWEADDPSVDSGDLEPLQTITRRDQPLHRQRWQFARRREHQAQMIPVREGKNDVFF